MLVTTISFARPNLICCSIFCSQMATLFQIYSHFQKIMYVPYMYITLAQVFSVSGQNSEENLSCCSFLGNRNTMCLSGGWAHF